MPHALMVLPDTYDSVIRRVAVDLTEQLSHIINIPGNTAVYLPGNTDKVALDQGNFGACCATVIAYDPEARVTIRYQDIADDNFSLPTAVDTFRNLPVWYDKTRDITVSPVRRMLDFRVDIEYQAEGIVTAKRWLDEQRNRISRGGAELTLKLDYYYMLPLPLQALLRGLYDTIQCSDWPMKETFDEYMKQYFCQSNTHVATLTLEHAQPAIRERQLDVVGWFDFTGTPDTPAANSDKAGAYTVSMSFTVRFEQPTHIYVRYPLICHQNPIPNCFWPRTQPKRYQAVERKQGYLRGPLDKRFVAPRPKHVPYIQYPLVNDWITDMKPADSFTFYTGLVSIEKTDLRSLLDLKNIGDWKFTGHFMEYFSDIGTAAIIRPGGLFNFRLYKNNDWMDLQLELEPGTTMLRAPFDLDPTKYYHIEISIDRNWWCVHDSVWDTLRRYPTVFWTICNLFSVGPGVRPMSEMQLLGAKLKERVFKAGVPGEGTSLYTADLPVIKTGEVTIKDVTLAREMMERRGGPWFRGNRDNIMTVMCGDIVTTRK